MFFLNYGMVLPYIFLSKGNIITIKCRFLKIEWYGLPAYFYIQINIMVIYYHNFIKK